MAYVYCAFVYGVLNYFTFDEKLEPVRLKFIITLVYWYIGFGFVV
jgi:hypothetical protein